MLSLDRYWSFVEVRSHNCASRRTIDLDRVVFKDVLNGDTLRVLKSLPGSTDGVELVELFVWDEEG